MLTTEGLGQSPGHLWDSDVFGWLNCASVDWFERLERWNQCRLLLDCDGAELEFFVFDPDRGEWAIDA